MSLAKSAWQAKERIFKWITPKMQSSNPAWHDITSTTKLLEERETYTQTSTMTDQNISITMSSLTQNTTNQVHLNHHFTLSEIMLIGVSSVSASLFTVLGNALVIIAFIVNRQLRTINNYLIINLAIADFFVGLISMNFFAVYTIQGGWYLGPVLCDFWLTLDYVASNTSVMNLLIICVDRYLSVQHAIWYRNKRSIKHAVAAMIFSWVISLLIWGVPIIGYQFWSESGRDLPPAQCYVQFLQANEALTIVTAFLAFYLPAICMVLLYWRVYTGIYNRRK